VRHPPATFCLVPLLPAGSSGLLSPHSGRALGIVSRWAKLLGAPRDQRRVLREAATAGTDVRLLPSCARRVPFFHFFRDLTVVRLRAVGLRSSSGRGSGSTRVCGPRRQSSAGALLCRGCRPRRELRVRRRHVGRLDRLLAVAVRGLIPSFIARPWRVGIESGRGVCLPTPSARRFASSAGAFFFFRACSDRVRSFRA